MSLPQRNRPICLHALMANSEISKYALKNDSGFDNASFSLTCGLVGQSG